MLSIKIPVFTFPDRSGLGDSETDDVIRCLERLTTAWSDRGFSAMAEIGTQNL